MIKKSWRNFLNKYLWADRKDILAMQYLAPLSKTYLPWTSSSMRPSALVIVLNDIVINRRTCILECGGGISTFYMARLLKEKGGHLYTVEHDKEWAEILNWLLKQEGLSECVSVIPAPLVKTDLAINENLWYDTKIIGDIISGQKIDLLIVDGPLAYTKELMYARYPAVPYYKNFLATEYTIVLDDINRQGEQEILLKWEKELGILFQKRLADGNIGIGSSKRSFKI
ncbi:class I SAM-dependent methyltransferase [Argonema galeatum]|uniref:class I SAM-dependent methyltransferase n=1 Tax=Argonema galeatum TaxID=2942762 RepID=UPI002013432F|nr:class I SAM-dependent methyltransferase [Argonema galeatum]MCL1467693.1 class I SAM-dependent methyltransferase [Argonema galeatum A003/A1]